MDFGENNWAYINVFAYKKPRFGLMTQQLPLLHQENEA